MYKFLSSWNEEIKISDFNALESDDDNKEHFPESPDESKNKVVLFAAIDFINQDLVSIQKGR